MKEQDASKLLCTLLRTDSSAEGNPIQTVDLCLSDWKSVLRQAIRHRVAPVLHRTLESQQFRSVVPEEILQRLKRTYLHTLATNTRRLNNLAALIDHLTKHNIEIMVLKGAHLAEAIYPSPGLRPMGDIDILIDEKDIDRTMHAISSMKNTEAFKHPDLDIHTALHPNLSDLSLTPGELRGRSVPLSIEGRSQTRALCPEDLFLFMILHLCLVDLFSTAGLRTLVDLREIVIQCSQVFNWHAFTSRATLWHVVKPVLVTLSLAEELIGLKVPLPPSFREKQKRIPASVLAYAREQMCTQAPYRRAFSPLFWNLWRADSLKSKLGSLKGLLIPSRTIISLQSHASPGSGRMYWSYWQRARRRIPFYAQATLNVVKGRPEMLDEMEEEERRHKVRKWLMKA